jgi:hypothetical protein
VKLGSLLAFVSVCLVVVQASAGHPAAKPKPRVWVVDKSPIVVAATGFGARERVTLGVATAGARYAKTLRASAAGRVRAEWQGAIQIDACHSVVLTAVGASGLRATAKWPRGGVECNQLQPVDQ